MMRLRFRGRYDQLSSKDRRALLDRAESSDPRVAESVTAILADVRARGDGALADLAKRFDPAVPKSIEVPRPDMLCALDAIDPMVRAALERSARNIDRVHRAGIPQPYSVAPEPGIAIERRPEPLGRVGIYAPGGRAAYPSSVLMAAVPARAAGVGEVILCSPPGPSGMPSEVVLAAAALAGVDRVFAVGGAGAVAAMAYGTATIPRVDRIVGPGNAWVAAAKLQVVSAVAIDSPAGPSELLVIVGDAASVPTVAMEMLAQAEHDPMACVVAVCVGEAVATDVERALARGLEAQPRSAIIAEALANSGAVLMVDSLAAAAEVATAYAPEHLLLAGGAAALVDRVRSAGTVFVGDAASVSFGDYMTGANHVLPTGGLARAYSGLSVSEFFRWTTIQRVDSEAARSLANDTAAFARSEGLPGHAIAAARWSER